MEHSHLTINGSDVLVELDADDLPSPSQLAVTADLARFDTIARAALAADRAPESAVALYVEHHLAELLDRDLEATFGPSSRGAVDRPRVLAQLVLDRVGVYPDRVVLDYTLPDRITDYLLVVAFDHEGRVVYIDMES